MYIKCFHNQPLSLSLRLHMKERFNKRLINKDVEGGKNKLNCPILSLNCDMFGDTLRFVYINLV